MKKKKLDPRSTQANNLLMGAAGVAYRATDAEITALPVPPGQTPAMFRAEFRRTIDKIVKYRKAGENSAAAAHATGARYDYAAAWDDTDGVPEVFEAEQDADIAAGRAAAEAIANPYGSQAAASTEDENDPYVIARNITTGR